MSDFAPTPEQEAALAAFMTGDNVAVEALAGTGKTSTLRLMGASTKDRGVYLAFNRAIVEEARRKMPANVAPSTVHSLAMAAVGSRYRHRLSTGRMRSADQARALGIDPLVINTRFGTKRLAPGFLAGLVMRSIRTFCASADDRPDVHHVRYIDGLDLPGDNGERRYENNNLVRAHIAPALARAWADLSSTDGGLPFNHDVYLKLWAMSYPVIPADFVLVDECQDLSGVMLQLLSAQHDAQLVFVGDAQQSIYGWRGAVNAFDHPELFHLRTALTKSFRFGPEIARAANAVLEVLGTPLRVEGHEPVASLLSELSSPDCVLTRTNAQAVSTVLRAQSQGRSAHLVGGGAEVIAFVRAAMELIAGERTFHPELACFESWGEVQAYVANDELGDELKLLVDMIDDHGAERVLRSLESMPREEDADLVVSTAHKAKGREWDTVQLAPDFKYLDAVADRDRGEEWRLLYVAATRARHVLDVDACMTLGVLLGLQERPTPNPLNLLDAPARPVETTQGGKYL